jgi:hypothetical protein
VEHPTNRQPGPGRRTTDAPKSSFVSLIKTPLSFRLGESERYAKLLVTANVLFSLFNPTEAEMASVTIGLQSF